MSDQFDSRNQPQYSIGRYFWPLLVAAGLLAASLVVLIIYAAQSVDKLQLEYESRIAGRMIADNIERLQIVVDDNANWTEAVLNLEIRPSEQWAQANFSGTVADLASIDGFLAIAADGRLIFRDEDGEHAEMADLFLAGLGDLVEAASHSRFSGWANGLIGVDGHIYSVAASRVQSSSMPVQPADRRAVIVALDRITEDEWSARGKEYSLRELKLLNPGTSDDKNHFELMDAHGVTLGGLTWVSDSPGAAFIASMRVPLMLALLMFVGFVVLYGRRTSSLIADQNAMVAELETARSNAISASDAKSEFLSRMSHELRTPLNAILGFSQLLLIGKDKLLRGKAVKFVEEQHKAGKHLLNLVNEVLDIVRIEDGRMDLELRALDLQTLVAESLELIRPQAEQHDLTIEFDCGPPDPPSVLADEHRLRQVMINLLSNAVKYNAEQGIIRVRLSTLTADRVRIAISDTGIGIAENDHHKVFEPFSRFGEKQHQEGTGIGLSISAQLVKAMHGSIDFSSQPGHGSTFYVDLPAATRH